MDEDDDLDYVVPAEGSQLWVDSMCIPRGGPNPENAHSFINFILDGKVHGAIATTVRYPCPNAAALDFIPPEDRANPALYPPNSVLERCEIPVYKGEKIESLYADALTPRARSVTHGQTEEKRIFCRAIVIALMVS